MPPQSFNSHEYHHRSAEHTSDPRPSTPGRLPVSSHQQSDRNLDQTSVSSANVSHDGTAPRSVYLKCTPLTRDLSDLSGSYANGTNGSSFRRGSKAPSVPGQIDDPAFFKGPWRQAFILSKTPPKHKENVAPGVTSKEATIFMSTTNDIVELVSDNLNVGAGATAPKTSLDLDTLPQQHNRIPIMILLMDGTKHSYELMQIWVDRGADSVGGLVQSLQQSIPDKWKQAYDGVFQVRGNRFTQLINILRLGKYQIQDHEILIAKPWSMAAKMTIAYATSAIRHLTAIGMIHTDKVDKAGRRVFRPKNEEAPLVLSAEARQRMYFPDGVLSHHHAVQFMSFCPAFETNNKKEAEEKEPKAIVAVDGDADSSLGSHGLNSLGSPPRFEDNVVDAIQSQDPPAKSPIDPPEQEGHEIFTENFQGVELLDSDLQDYPQRRRKKLTYFASKLNCSKKSRDRLEAEEAVAEAQRAGACICKLNCCKTPDRPSQDPEVKLAPPTPQTSNCTPSPEDKAIQWRSFDSDINEDRRQGRGKEWDSSNIQPIVEDNQSTTGHSIVSMSAPLLSTQPRGMRMRLGEF